MPALVAPAPRNQVGTKDADRFELCGEACLASALGIDVETVATWLRQHEGGEQAVQHGTSPQALIDFCQSRGISARVVNGPAVQYVAQAAARGHYAVVLVWSDHQGNPLPQNQSTKLAHGGIGHWLLGYGTAGAQVEVMQPWGGRLLSYDLSHGQDQRLGIEISHDVGVRQPQVRAAPASARVYIVKSGDTLSAIAAREHVTLQRLLAANPQIKNKNLIFPGQRIAVPN